MSASAAEPVVARYLAIGFPVGMSHQRKPDRASLLCFPWSRHFAAPSVVAFMLTVCCLSRAVELAVDPENGTIIITALLLECPMFSMSGFLRLAQGREKVVVERTANGSVE